MITRIVKCILFLSIWATPMVAQDWQKLDGLAIEDALNSRTLDYGEATQDFFPDGRTSYKTEEKNWGRWRVKYGQYCSIWPPSDVWVCYDIETKDVGLWLRFIGKDGNIFTGRYVDRD